MPKLACPCGFVHNLSPIPDDGWVTVRDKDYESLLDAERVLHEISGGAALPPDDHPHVGEYDEAVGRTSSLQGRLYECPHCGTLLWCKQGSKQFREFRPPGAAGEV
jgi:hypothetical protein